ncbi:MAG: HAD-IA family hydrolase [Bacteroidales bacterium]|nr:HAD-IA family hydrolase [Bacteroidales bacterium]
MINKSLIIFDFDGTLADTFESGAKLINSFAEKFGYEKIDFAKNKNKSARELIKMSKVRFWQIPKLVKFFRTESDKMADNIKPFFGINNLLSILYKDNYDLGIVTTNSKTTVSKFLTANNLDQYFIFLITDISLFGKKRILKRVIRQNKTKYRNIIYIGDEIRDIEACNKANMSIISVSWGFNSEDILKTQNNWVANSTDDVVRILKKIDAF